MLVCAPPCLNRCQFGTVSTPARIGRLGASSLCIFFVARATDDKSLPA